MFSFRRGKEKAAFPDFFSLLSVLPAFDLDLEALETAYFKEQRRYHPDRFVGATDEERIAALQKSADINQGYETLKNPLKRAQYLLLLQGIFVGTEKDSVKPTKALLTEIMELREAIEEAKNLSELYKLADKLNVMYESLLEVISTAYNDSTWDDMAQSVIKFGYVLKALEEIEQRQSRFKK